MGKGREQPHGGKITPFEKGETGNPNGRPKKLVSSLIAQLKEEGYEGVTNGQISDVISLLLNLEKDRVKQLAEDAKQPIYVQRISRRLVTATDKEIGDFIDKQLDRAHGKAKQQVDHTSGGEKISGGTVLSAEQEEALSKILRGG
jgi:tRNA U34 2-thiouridine synthase MnmA/TrmU